MWSDRHLREDNVRRFLKFSHTIGAIGMMGALACLLALLWFAPPPTSPEGYAAARAGMGAVAKWVFMPSLGLTLIAGLLAIAASPVFHNAGWAWVKAATGILLFESGFVGVLGPMQAEAERSAKVLAGAAEVAGVMPAFASERNVLIVLLLLSVANVVLGVWRPRLVRRRAGEQSSLGQEDQAGG
jgi:hypothetical protein